MAVELPRPSGAVRVLPTPGEGGKTVVGEILGFGDVSPSWLASELDEHGVVRLSGVFTEEWVRAMRASVTDYMKFNGDVDFYVDHADHDVDSPAHRLVSDTAVRQLFAETIRLRRPHASWANDVMRCSMLVLAGTVRKAPSRRFHYDPCVLTMIVPVFIPQATFGTCGELAVFKNKRPFRRFFATHLIDTIQTHNPLYRRYVTARIHDAPEKYVVDLQPGDAYLFWGYRTFHGNLDCAPGLLRTTLVLKYGEVHPSSNWASRVAWRLSRSRRDLRRFQNGSPPPAMPAAFTSELDESWS